MKITTGMIWDSLSEKCDAKFYGVKHSIALKRPVLYEPEQVTDAECIYVATEEYLPLKPQFCSNSLLICVGKEPRKVYTRGNFPVIWLKNISFWSAFNIIQQIYDDYISWELNLQKIIESDIDFAEITRISLPFIGNPIAILDEEFYHIAITRWERQLDGSMLWKVEAPMFPLPVNRISKVAKARIAHKNVLGIYSVGKPEMENAELMQDDPESDSLELRCVNLFVTGRHMGTITIANFARPFKESDEEIILFFKSKVEEALKRRAKIRTIQTATLKSVISDYINGDPVSNHRLQHITTKNQKFICVKIMRIGNNSHLPVDYVCTILEDTFAGCVAIEYDTCIAMIIDFSIFPYDYKKFLELFETCLKELGYKAGISDIFFTIAEVRNYHRQAVCAYEVGIEMDPDKNIYSFWDYALIYMLQHGTGEFSLEYLIPPELRMLQRKNKEMKIDYWKTLRTYLDNNMNASQTAKDLYLHRSSFLARLKYIHSVLGNNLQDPKKRLWYQMILYLCDTGYFEE